MASTYRVQSGDNLWSIAEKLFGDGRAMKRIMYLNGMNSTVIRPGMTLKLPVIVKGRNDTFRITNAEANNYGLASEQQIASGQYGGGTPYLSGTAGTGGSTKEAMNAANAGAGGTQPGTPLRPGETTSSSAMERALGQQALSNVSSYLAGVDLSGMTDFGGGGQADPMGVYKAYTSLKAKQRQQAGQANAQNVPGYHPIRDAGPTQYYGNKPAEEKDSGSIFGRIAQSVAAGLPEVANKIGSSMDDFGETWTEEEKAQMQRIQDKVDAYDAQGVSGMTQAQLERLHENLKTQPHDRPGDLSPGAMDVDPALGTFYASKLEGSFIDGTTVDVIPTTVLKTDTFPYTVEEMAALGYRLSANGGYFVPVKRGVDEAAAEAISSTSMINPYTGRVDDTGYYSGGYSSGGGGYSGGGGGGGYSGGGGGGGGGVGVGGGQVGSVENDLLKGVVRGAGSWKGINFG